MSVPNSSFFSEFYYITCYLAPAFYVHRQVRSLTAIRLLTVENLAPALPAPLKEKNARKRSVLVHTFLYDKEVNAKRGHSTASPPLPRPHSRSLLHRYHYYAVATPLGSFTQSTALREHHFVSLWSAVAQI